MSVLCGFKGAHIGREHHELCSSYRGLVLEWTVPFTWFPDISKKKLEILVRESRGVDHPWTIISLSLHRQRHGGSPIEAGPVRMASTHVVSTRKGDNLLIRKSHTAKDLSNMISTKCSIWQSIDQLTSTNRTRLANRSPTVPRCSVAASAVL